MNRKVLALASGLVVLTMLAASLAVGRSLPADRPLPIHWGLDGVPDRYSDKWTALLLPVGMTAGIWFLFYFLPALEPRRQGLERSRGLYLLSWAALLLMMASVQLALVSLALRWPVHANRLIVAGLGAMFVLIGNQLGKSRSMYLMGLRTPWTLASEDVWIKTHRLAGKLMVAGGLVAVGAAALPLPSGLLATAMLAVILITAGVPAVYSLLLWRHEQAAHPSE
jgi:uncharacterized membrane protein